MLIDQNKYVVLMTACIDPGEGIKTKPGNCVGRADPSLRLNDYIEALKYWLNFNDQRLTGIVFADNSGYDLNSLRRMFEDCSRGKPIVEFIQVEKCVWPDHIHYGFCELLIIDDALKKSELLKEAPLFIKATGRLRFDGLIKMLDVMGRDFINPQFVVDAHDYAFPFGARHSGISTQLMVFNTNFYRKNLIGINKLMKPWVISHIEDLLFIELSKFKGAGYYMRFPCYLSCVGFCATTNKNYRSFKSKMKDLLRRTSRKVAPWWWI